MGARHGGICLHAPEFLEIFAKFGVSLHVAFMLLELHLVEDGFGLRGFDVFQVVRGDFDGTGDGFV